MTSTKSATKGTVKRSMSKTDREENQELAGFAKILRGRITGD